MEQTQPSNFSEGRLGAYCNMKPDTGCGTRCFPEQDKVFLVTPVTKPSRKLLHLP